MTQMDDIFGEVVQSMPVQLVEPVERMINRDVRYRPTMQYFMSASICLFASVSLSLSFSSSRLFILHFAEGEVHFPSPPTIRHL